jgi:hypothetical protein
MHRTVEVPNLDDSSGPEIRAFRRRMNRMSPDQSVSVFGNARTARDLAHYCRLTLAARRARLRGNVRNATADENLKDSIYRSLPASAKW